ncbi:hypothetical protein D3C75_784610 [compost metagenome]
MENAIVHTKWPQTSTVKFICGHFVDQFLIMLNMMVLRSNQFHIGMELPYFHVKCYLHNLHGINLVAVISESPG